MFFKEYTIKEICEINKEYYSEKENWTFFNYLDTKNIVNNKINEIKFLDPSLDKIPSRAKRKVDNNDIIISTVRPNQRHYGIIRDMPSNFLVSTGFTTLNVNNEIALSEFIYYSITGEEVINSLQSIAEQSTTSYPSIKSSDIANLKVNLPSLDIQKKIISILTFIESKIKVNENINHHLMELANFIFKENFINFENYSSEDLVTSDFGLIPEKWNYKTLAEISDVGIGKTPPRKEQKWFSINNGVKWVSIKDLGNSGTFIFETSEYLTSEAINKFNVNIVPKNTILLSFKLTVGRIAITSEDMVTNEAIAHFKLGIDSEVSKEYLYLYLKNFNFETLGSTSSIAKAINSKIVKKIPILIPATEELKSFSNFIEKIFNFIKNNQIEIKKLENIWDILLPKLMSGEIDVSNVKI